MLPNAQGVFETHQSVHPVSVIMYKHDLVYLTEDASHDAAIEHINEEAFGPGRFTRAAARIREQGPHDLSLSFICADDGETIASVRMTPVLAGTVLQSTPSEERCDQQAWPGSEHQHRAHVTFFNTLKGGRDERRTQRFPRLHHR